MGKGGGHNPGEQIRQYFVEEPFTWEKVRELIQKGDEGVSLLGRSKEQCEFYCAGKERLLKEFASMADLVKIKILGFGHSISEDGRKQANQEPPTQDQIIKFVENDFPYNFDASMEHHVLWSTQSLDEQEIANIVKKYRDGWETLCFHNPAALRSIPSVWHIHVVSRKLPANI